LLIVITVSGKGYSGHYFRTAPRTRISVTVFWKSVYVPSGR